MPTYLRDVHVLLTLPWLSFIEGFSLTKTVISLSLLGLIYQLVSRRALYARAKPAYLFWWGGLVLLSWALLIYFAIEIKWVWNFLFR